MSEVRKNALRAYKSGGDIWRLFSNVKQQSVMWSDLSLVTRPVSDQTGLRPTKTGLGLVGCGLSLGLASLVLVLILVL